MHFVIPKRGHEKNLQKGTKSKRTLYKGQRTNYKEKHINSRLDMENKMRSKKKNEQAKNEGAVRNISC